MPAKQSKKTEDAKKESKRNGKAGKTKEAAAEAPPAAFDLLKNRNRFIAASSAGLKKAIGRRKGRSVLVSSQADMRIGILPVESIYMQWAINSRGFPIGLTNFLGKDAVGKTSLVYYLMGHFMVNNIPCCVVPCEKKVVPIEWADRCLSRSRSQAFQLSEALVVLQDMLVLDEAVEKVTAWVTDVVRNPACEGFVPSHIPVAVFFDPLNKMATRAQAQGLVMYDGLDKEDVMVDLTDRGHMMDRAKFYQQMTIRLNNLQTGHNVHFIVSEHQNQDDPMGQRSGGRKTQMFQTLTDKDSKNRTRAGGEAINQSAGMQITLVDCGKYYSGGEAVGRRIMARVLKNSYGGGERVFYYAIKSDGFNDTRVSLDQGIRFDWSEVLWLSDQRLLGFRRTGDSYKEERFSSDVLGISAATLCEAADIWTARKHEFQDELGKKLRIPGYYDPRAAILDEAGKEASGA
jgi:hypothetical protein